MACNRIPRDCSRRPSSTVWLSDIDASDIQLHLKNGCQLVVWRGMHRRSSHPSTEERTKHRKNAIKASLWTEIQQHFSPKSDFTKDRLGVSVAFPFLFSYFLTFHNLINLCFKHKRSFKQPIMIHFEANVEKKSLNVPPIKRRLFEMRPTPTKHELILKRSLLYVC
jgi:hypothetical protein